MIRKRFPILLILLFTVGFLNAQNMRKLIKKQFEFADKQYKILQQHTPENRMPKTYYAKDNKWETSDTHWWCSGFYPGSLLYIYENTKDTFALNEAERRLKILQKEDHNTHTHDLGFMMFTSFGNAYRITHNPLYKAVIDTSAAALSTRFRPKIPAIQSWDSSKKLRCPVIIDNMMNLELLCWDAQHGGSKRFQKIAELHANTTMKNHFRKDYSSFHVVDYNPETGAIIKRVTAQGANDSSAWSRGQAWGLYGYTMMYRFTKDTAYLNQAKHIAHFILTNPNLPKDLIPYWDYNAPNLPDAPRDASAASVMASAFLELGQYVDEKERKQYVADAKKIIRNLSSPEYRAKLGENGGFILKHSVGSLPAHSEVDVPLTYADYYFLEALHRYKEWYL
ncbi:glucuronyl hydrolase [Arachidicoccus ginsenosidimutans]|uniref:glycoside hydrolase family 88 protein n=1 Tax=Arachidicoccus sp. BS20 TaxID=1850526 RepID=UPI0007F0EBBB|nr:glycoside hydrolase family 88 protein [Arachidicoccus sp. BS20]ANI89006.1 glucuronyl hydrolase [Arachidicoccus sp. BS20]